MKTLFLIISTFTTGFSQCLRLRGNVSDITNGKAIEAQIFVKEGNKKTLIGQSNATGKYEVAVPCGAAVLVVEKSGYRALIVPINYNESIPEKANFAVPLPLIPLDRQINDRPYAQAEQKEFVLKDTAKNNQQYAIRHFKAFDAIDNRFVSANVCLFFTKNKQKNCFQTNTANPYFDVKFQSKDIVALEVSAEGYQSYNGNLILDQLDGQVRLYEIKLSRALTVLSVTLTEPTTPYRIIIKTDADKDWTDLSKAGSNRFYGMVAANKNYQICILNEKKQVTNVENLTIKTGVNYLIITPKIPPKPAEKPVVKEPVMATSTAPKPEAVQPNYVFYFDQSNYQLREETKQELNKLAAWLEANKQQKIRVIGHTDNVGDPALNVALSEFRAKATVSYLLTQKVLDTQIEWRGVGGKYPVLPNETEENRRQNRRVEVKLIE